MPNFEDDLTEDDFEIIEGPEDRKLYKRQTDGILIEFSSEGVRGGMGKKGEMKMVISFKEVFSITCLFPDGFPRARRPIVFLSNPDPGIVNHIYVANDGQIIHPEMLNWNYSTSLSSVLRKIYNNFLANPPVLKSSAIRWNLSSSSIPPPPKIDDVLLASHERIYEHQPKVQEAPIHFEAAPDSFATGLSLSQCKSMVSIQSNESVVSKRDIVKVDVAVPTVPTFDGQLSDMSLSQLEATADDNDSLVTVMTENYSKDLQQCVASSNNLISAAKQQLSDSSDAVLAATLTQSQLIEEVKSLKEQANILQLTRQGVQSRADSTAADAVSAELKDAAGLVEALTESMQSESALLDSDFLFGTYHDAAVRYHLLKQKSKSLTSSIM